MSSRPAGLEGPQSDARSGPRKASHHPVSTATSPSEHCPQITAHDDPHRAACLHLLHTARLKMHRGPAQLLGNPRELVSEILGVKGAALSIKLFQQVEALSAMERRVGHVTISPGCLVLVSLSR